MLTRAGNDAARAHTHIAVLFGMTTVQYPLEADGRSARITLERLNDHRLTLTDATIAAMAVRLDLRALTFDKRHFGLMGAKVYE